MCDEFPQQTSKAPMGNHNSRVKRLGFLETGDLCECAAHAPSKQDNNNVHVFMIIKKKWGYYKLNYKH